MNPFLAGFVCVVAVGVVEMVLSAKWNRAYFTAGLPIFMKRVDRLENFSSVSLEALQKGSATAAGAPLMFQLADPDLILFREATAGGTIHYISLMRGLIRYKREESFAVVLGHVNWWAVVLVVGLVAILRRHVGDVAFPVAAGIGVLYFIQGVRFWRVGNALRKESTAKLQA